MFSDGLDVLFYDNSFKVSCNTDILKVLVGFANTEN